MMGRHHVNPNEIPIQIELQHPRGSRTVFNRRMPHSQGHFIECSDGKNDPELQFQARQFNKRRLMFMQ